MIPNKVKNYLQKNQANFEVIEHRPVFTAHDLAMTLHMQHSQIVKNLLVKADNQYILALLPADKNLAMDKLAKLVKAKKISMPKEKVMTEKFKVKPGALPAFGGIYKLPVFVDKIILRQKKILLSPGSFVESVLMNPKDYIKLEQAILGSFSVNKKFKQPKLTKPGRKVKKVKNVTKKKMNKKKKK